MGINTTFNLEQVFELGQLEIYENIEDRPDIEVTTQKVLDGYPPIYLMATQGSATATLAGRSVPKVLGSLTIFDAANDSSSGIPKAQVTMSGLQVSSLTYTFPTEGNFTEDVTLVGNHKVWNKAAPFTFSGAFTTNADTPLSIAGSGGVNRREDLLFATTVTGVPTPVDVNSHLIDPNTTVLPGGTFGGILGISSSGTNQTNTDGSHVVCVQNITITTNLGREEIFCLGRKTPSCRFVTFPIEVTTDIEVLTCSGDCIGATEDGLAGNGDNVNNKSIRIAAREGLRLTLGTNNKLQSISYQGGSTGGENVTITYSYTNFNNLTVEHWNDPTAALKIDQL